MIQRLNFYKASPDAAKALMALETVLPRSAGASGGSPGWVPSRDVRSPPRTPAYDAPNSTAPSGATFASTVGAKSMYITGVTSRASKVELIRPPIRTTANGE